MAIKPVGCSGGNTTKKVAHDYANFVLGTTQSDIFATELQKAIRGTKDEVTKKYVGGTGFKGLGGKIKDAWNVSTKAVEGKSFWQVTKESFISIPGEFGAAKEAANIAGKFKLGKFLGESGKIFGKRMPLIGNILMVAMAVPNLVSAFTDKKHGGGVATGLAETGKTAVNFAAFAAGSAIGQAIIPIPVVGALIGGIVASFAADKILGKSFTDKKNEAVAQETENENKAQAAARRKQFEATPTGQAFAGNNPYSSNPFASNTTSNIDYMNQDIMSMNMGK